MTHGGVNYGHHLYGDAPIDSPSPAGERSGIKQLSPKDVFGSGVAVEPRSWDIIADNTGDLAATHGWDELRKDLGWRSTVKLQRKLNTLQTDANLKEIGRIVRKAFLTDPRLIEANIHEVRYQDSDEVYIESEVRSIYDLVSQSYIPL